MEFRQLVKKSDSFVKKIDQYKDIAVKNSDKLLIELNKQQLSRSKLSTGNTITPPYSPGYASFKGIPSPNLRLSGDFQDAMFLNVRGGNYLISSTDFKTALLITRYSLLIFGIFNKSIAKVATTKELGVLYKKNVL